MRSARLLSGWRAAAGVAAAAGALATLIWVRSARENEVACGGGLVPAGARCCETPVSRGGVCERSTAPPERMVLVPDTHLVAGPSDWEAEGRVAARKIDVHAFYMDAFEAADRSGDDPARARSGVSFGEAAAYCRDRKKRLPTEDEWIAAAGGSAGRRYPWGDTGAVCRRAAWGLARGPCATGARGPDSVGAHPDGRTPLGLEDMAGNVAEWVVAPEGPVARGGSWESALATDLRTWARVEMDPTAHDPRMGFRCARDASPPEDAGPNP